MRDFCAPEIGLQSRIDTFLDYRRRLHISITVQTCVPLLLVYGDWHPRNFNEGRPIDRKLVLLILFRNSETVDDWHL